MISEKPIRWGILGTGWVAQRFLVDLSSVPGAEATAIASKTEARAQMVARGFGVRRGHASYEALLADPEVDVVYVATDHHEHARNCLAALANGKHVLCEKPFATSAGEALVVANAATKAGLFCMEAMWSRFLPGMTEAKRRIDSGDIGVAAMLTADFSAPIVDDDSSSRFFDPERGGGALLDRGVYAVSLATWLFGKPISVVASADLHERGTDRSMSAILGFQDNRLAVLSASLGVYSSNQAVIAGSKGRIVLHEPFYRPEQLSVRRVSPSLAGTRSDMKPRSARERVRRLVSTMKPYLPIDLLRTDVVRCPIWGYGYAHEAAEVVRCIREGLHESPVMPLRDTVTTMTTLDQIRERFGK